MSAIEAVLDYYEESGKDEVSEEARKELVQFYELADYYKRVINEPCPTDEQHCTCVPALRAEIERIKKVARDVVKHRDVGSLLRLINKLASALEDKP